MRAVIVWSRHPEDSSPLGSRGGRRSTRMRWLQSVCRWPRGKARALIRSQADEFTRFRRDWLHSVLRSHRYPISVTVTDSPGFVPELPPYCAHFSRIQPNLLTSTAPERGAMSARRLSPGGHREHAVRAKKGSVPFRPSPLGPPFRPRERLAHRFGHPAGWSVGSPETRRIQFDRGFSQEASSFSCQG